MKEAWMLRSSVLGAFFISRGTKERQHEVSGFYCDRNTPSLTSQAAIQKPICLRLHLQNRYDKSLGFDESQIKFTPWLHWTELFYSTTTHKKKKRKIKPKRAALFSSDPAGIKAVRYFSSGCPPRAHYILPFHTRRQKYTQRVAGNRIGSDTIG